MCTALALTGCLWTTAAAQDESPQEDDGAADAPAAAARFDVGPIGRAVLRFDGKRKYRGTVEVTEGGELALDARGFSEPAIIDWAAVVGYERVDDDERPLEIEASSEGASDLLSALRGQSFRGRVTAVTDQFVAFDSRQFGSLAIPREIAGVLVHDSGVQASASSEPESEPGPASDAEPANAESPTGEAVSADSVGGAWRDWNRGHLQRGAAVQAGNLELTKFGASVWREIPADDRRLSFDLAWLGAPEFALVVDGDPLAEVSAGADPIENSGEHGIVIEPWDGLLTMTRRSEDGLALEQAAFRLPEDSEGILRMAIDRDRVTLLAFEGADGRRSELGISMVRTAPEAARDTTSIECIARGRRLRVHEVVVEGAQAALDEQGRLVVERRIRGSEVIAFDADLREIAMDRGRTSFDSGEGIQFLHRSRAEELFIAKPEQGFGRLVMRNGESVEVDFVVFEDGAFRVKPRWADDACTLDPNDVLDLQFDAMRSSTAKGAFEYRLGSGKALTAGFAGIDVMNDVPVLQRKEPGFKTVVTAEIDEPLFIKRGTRSLFHASRRKYPHEIVLTNGQSFPARLVAVADATLSVRTPFGRDVVEIARGDVKAVLLEPIRLKSLLTELKAPEPGNGRQNGIVFVGRNTTPRVDPTSVTNGELDRALQILRTQKDDPGTHLLVARNGDLLRTNAVRFDEDTLHVDGGAGGPLEVPIDLLAAWVHVAPDDEPSGLLGEDESGDDSTLWTVVLNARSTLRMTLKGTQGDAMTFHHPVLGEVHIGTEEFERLEYKRAFQPEERVFMSWVTRPIAEPNLDPNR